MLDQFTPRFCHLPQQQTPAIVDNNPLTGGPYRLFESVRSCSIGRENRNCSKGFRRARCNGYFGRSRIWAVLGKSHSITMHAPVPYAIERTAGPKRLYGVLEPVNGTLTGRRQLRMRSCDLSLVVSHPRQRIDLRLSVGA